ncbi:MAG TPA: hypothetical protein VGB51_03875 [Actinomycetota bacterium]
MAEPRRSRSAARVRRAPARGVSQPMIAVHERLDHLVESLGNNRVAELLEVSRSQPTRWRSGKEGISPANERRVTDLEYIIARLLQLFPKDLAETWLTSQNAHLGARPVDVLRLRGPAAVIQAVDAEAQGAYA